MYSLGMPVSAIRTKIRQEFEKHRYVSQLPVVDVLLYQSHAEFQVSPVHLFCLGYMTCLFRRADLSRRPSREATATSSLSLLDYPLSQPPHNSRIKY